MWLKAQLQCLYINVCSMENKRKELETMVQLENYDLTVSREIQWNDSRNCNTMIESYKLLEGLGEVGEVGELSSMLRSKQNAKSWL